MKKIIIIIFLLATLIIYKPIKVYTNNVTNKPLLDKSPVLINDPELEKDTLNVLVIEINPVLNTVTTPDGKHPKVSELVNGSNSTQVSLNELIEDFEDSSHGYLKIKTKMEYLNEFPKYTSQINLKNGKKGYRIDEETYLSEIKYDGTGKYNSDYWFNLLNGPLWSNLPSFSFDYEYIINKFDLVNRKNKKEFDQVWLLTIDPSQTYETNMVGRKAFWINGQPIKKDCDNFVLANISISRRDANYHALGHGMEGILYNVFDVTYGKDYQANVYNITNESEYNKLNLWQKFTLNALNNKSTYITGVGNVHYPFNSKDNYGYEVTTKTNTNWESWLNYPNISVNTTKDNNKAWTSNPINNKIMTSSSEEKDPDRLYTRFWSSLFPHITGYTEDGYLNNWWKYIKSYDYVKSVSKPEQSYLYHPGDTLTLMVNLNYATGITQKNIVIKYDKNVKIHDSNIVKNEGKTFKVINTGTTDIDVYFDGKKTTFTITSISKPNQDGVFEPTTKETTTNNKTTTETPTSNNIDTPTTTTSFQPSSIVNITNTTTTTKVVEQPDEEPTNKINPIVYVIAYLFVLFVIAFIVIKKKRNKKVD